MHLVLEQLNAAGKVFRSIIELEEPMFSRIPIINAKPDPNNRRPWSFSTDNQQINANVYKPAYILDKFLKVIGPLYEKAYRIKIDDSNKDDFVRNIIQDNFTYLHFHEIFHPLYSPDSDWKIRTDEKTGEIKKEPGDKQLTDYAIEKAIQRTEPNLSPREVTNKAGNVKNAVWDFIIDDVFFYLSNFNNNLEKRIAKEFEKRQKSIGIDKIKKMPDGVVPIWDVVELASETPQSMFYPITRAMYGLLFAKDHEIRKNIFDYFKSKVPEHKLKSELEDVLKDTLHGITKYFDQDDFKEARISPKRYKESVDDLLKNYDKALSEKSHEYLVTKITESFFNKKLRYKAIEGIIEPLSKYISLQKEENRHGAGIPDQAPISDGQTSPSETGGNAEESLESFISLAQEQDVQNYLTSIANDISPPQTPRNIRLRNLAIDEYYKKNAKPMPVNSPKLEAISIELGKIRRPIKVASYVLTEEQLFELPWNRIQQFQLETGIAQLIQLTPHQWRYDEYEWKETPIEDFRFEKSGIELPKNIIFHLDSSGTMLSPGGTSYVGSGSRFDGLQHVNYGILKTMLKAAKTMNKEIYVIAVNYSNSTMISDPIELSHFYNTPNNKGKQIMLTPQNGSTYYDVNAYKIAHGKCKDGKKVHIFVADGDLDNDHDANMRGFQWLASQPDTAILYFAMFNKGTFAERVDRFAKTKENVNFYYFSQFKQLQDAAINVLIQYK